MTNQEIMDIQWDWWVVQKRPRCAVRRTDGEGTVCRYRGENGSKCAVGVILTDEEAVRYEGASIDRSDIGDPNHRLSPNYEFLAELQLELEDAATDYGLELQGVDEDDEAGQIIEKANGNTRALSRFQAASERLDQALRVVMKQN